MTYLFIGGSKSGKSHLAQQLCRDLGGPLVYWATMEPVDGEDRARIENHLRDRDGWGFETLEAARSLPAAFDRLPKNATVLFDSATALLANEMFRPDGTMDQRRSCSRWRKAAAISSASATISGATDPYMIRGQRNTGGSSLGSAGRSPRNLTRSPRSSAVCRSFTKDPMERTLHERLVLRFFYGMGDVFGHPVPVPALA